MIDNKVGYPRTGSPKIIVLSIKKSIYINPIVATIIPKNELNLNGKVENDVIPSIAD